MLGCGIPSNIQHLLHQKPHLTAGDLSRPPIWLNVTTKIVRQEREAKELKRKPIVINVSDLSSNKTPPLLVHSH